MAISQSYNLHTLRQSIAKYPFPSLADYKGVTKLVLTKFAVCEPRSSMYVCSEIYIDTTIFNGA